MWLQFAKILFPCQPTAGHHTAHKKHTPPHTKKTQLIHSNSVSCTHHAASRQPVLESPAAPAILPLLCNIPRWIMVTGHPPLRWSRRVTWPGKWKKWKWFCLCVSKKIICQFQLSFLYNEATESTPATNDARTMSLKFYTDAFYIQWILDNYFYNNDRKLLRLLTCTWHMWQCGK